MFDVLVASGTHFELRPRSVSLSLVVHTLVLALAAVASRQALEGPTIAPVRAFIVIGPKAPEPPKPPEVKRTPLPPTVITEAPAKGFQTVAALRDLPTVIPPIDLTQAPLDPRDFTGRGVEGGVADGVVGGSGVVSTAAGALDAIYQSTTDDARFEQATLVSPPAPRYPKALDAVGVEGQVTLEFVIDTTGRVQPASIRVLRSTHEAFEAEARRAMASAVFHPATFSNRPVRQLTRQSIRFVTSH
jgi:TonB family protein